MSQPGVFALSGCLDASSHRRVKAVLGAALAYAAARSLAEVVVDVTAVRFADPGVVRFLADAQDTAAGSGRHLHVVGADRVVRGALLATGTGRRVLGREAGDPVHISRFPVVAGVRPGVGGGLGPGEHADLEQATAGRRRATDDRARLRRWWQQQAVDWEVRTTRRALLAGLRHRLRTEPRALSDDAFLAVADRPAVVAGILTAATIGGGADACDLQIYDQQARTWRSAGRRGLPAGYHTSAPVMPFGRVESAPVIIDDITLSPVFAGQPALELMRAAGLLAVRSYLLQDAAGRLIGVLSMHYRAAATRPGDADLVAQDAGSALAHLPAPDRQRPA